MEYRIRNFAMRPSHKPLMAWCANSGGGLDWRSRQNWSLTERKRAWRKVRNRIAARSRQRNRP